MKRVGYICPFVPREWIEAHGLEPVRFLPAPVDPSSSGQATAGVCPFIESMYTSITARQDLDLIVMTTVCDQMRRGSERLTLQQGIPVFLMHVPATWRNPLALNVYISELERLGKTLVRLGGTSPTAGKLWEVMTHIQEVRNHILSLRGQIPPHAFTEALVHFHESGQIPPISGSPMARPGVPVALLGSHQTQSYLSLFDLIENAGGTVELDATSSGERTLPSDFGCDGSNPLQSLASAYFESIPDAFRRPNDLLYTWLIETLAAREIRGILLLHPTWCDLWAAEAARIREWTGLPVLSLDPGPGMNLDPRHATRIEAFLEMLR